MSNIIDIADRSRNQVKKVDLAIDEVCLDFVVVQPILPEDKSKIIKPDTATKDNREMTQKSVVYQTGKMKNPKIKKGAVVLHNLTLFKGGSCYFLGNNGYIVMREHDIYCILK